MTRIDFYQTSGDEYAFACRLIDLVYRKGHQIYVHTSTAEQAKTLNEQLWTFKEDSFVPHSLHSEAMDVPIKIGFDHEPEEHQDVLINLSGQIPHFFPGSTGLQRSSLSTKIVASQLVRVTPTTKNAAMF